jgi:NADH-quinone oxidoreductase subunit G
MTDSQATLTLTINDCPVEVPVGTTVLQACQQLGVEVPVFCYHPKLEVAGNCRMCLVQIGTHPKPAASCALPAAQGMTVYTNTSLVHDARKGVLEFLLINHPLDCPICDQGGECDLQDITLAYGAGESRYREPKRLVDNPDLGPLIKTIMNRCIHCMRCVRFGKDIAGVSELGSLGRGEDTEVMTVVGQTVASELSGNMIDICPVGALTAKPYAFEGRPWEFDHTVCIDVHDAIGSNLRVDTRDGRVMRIVPAPNEAVNETWITDKARFSYDALRLQRLDQAYQRVNKQSGPEPCALDQAISRVAQIMQQTDPTRMAVVLGLMVDLETMHAVKKLSQALNIKTFCSAPTSTWVPQQGLGSYCLNTPLAQMEHADVCLLVAANPRTEAPLLNARLRKGMLHQGLKVGVLGDAVDLTYDYDHLGEDLAALNTLETLDHPFIQALQAAQKPLICVSGAIEHHDQARAIYHQVRRLAEMFKGTEPAWQSFNYLPLEASRVGALDLGLQTLDGQTLQQKLQAGEIDVLINLGCDEMPFDALDQTQMIYLGSHGEAGAAAADVILPTPAYPEKESTTVNAEGRVQLSHQALGPVGSAKPVWMWVHQLGQALGLDAFDSLEAVRRDLQAQHPHLKPGEFQPRIVGALPESAPAVAAGTCVTSPLKNFYQTNVISRLSPLMAACTHNKQQAERFAEEERP